MKHLTKILTFVFCLAITSGASHAQTAAPQPVDGIIWLSPEEFGAQLDAGTLRLITPGVLAEQQRRSHETAERSRAIVEDFLGKHPELTDISDNIHTVPDLNDPTISRASGGDYNFTAIDNLGNLQQFETMGEAFTLNNVAHAIQSATDPEAQLNLYTTLYNALPPNVVSPVGTAPSNLIPPAQLHGASLQVIQSALQQYLSQTQSIVNNLPPLGGKYTPASCQGDEGSSETSGINAFNGFGDQTQSAGCTTPSPIGIISNFTFAASPYLTCIKNQGQRGTCHIFGSTSAIEQMVAYDTGKHVNLNEQDFMAHEKALWNTALFGDGDDAEQDISDAAANGYRFAYEKQWDYNPSLDRGKNFVDSCEGYPSSETSCSNSSPQSPFYCTTFLFIEFCAVTLVEPSGSRSHYQATGTTSIYYPGQNDITTAFIQNSLWENIPVILEFNVTKEFQGVPNGYIPYHDSSKDDDIKTSIGGHVVHLIGYVSNAGLAAQIPSAPPGAGGGYFVIKNSWGACLGDAGYYYMPVDYLFKKVNNVVIVSPITF
jgi:hypothetical protein